jgi:hypothetical protein
MLTRIDPGAASGLLPTLKECDKLRDAEIAHRLTEMEGVGCWTELAVFAEFQFARFVPGFCPPAVSEGCLGPG